MCGSTKFLRNTPTDKSKSCWSSKELRVLLKWHQVPAKEMADKASRWTKWKSIVESKKKPPSLDKWGDEDEKKLVELKKTKIDIADTALGRLRATRQRELFASVGSMTPEQRQKLKQEIAAFEEPAGEPETDGIDGAGGSPDYEENVLYAA